MTSSDPILSAFTSGRQVFDLGRPLFNGMPQSPNHPRFSHALPRRHGDMTRDDGSSAANDLIVTGTHVGTHIDALSHVSHEGTMHGGVDAMTAQVGGGFQALGVHTIEPMVCRGVLLDIPAVLGEEACPADHEVTVDELEAAVDAQGFRPGAGDVLLIRTGWGAQFANGDAFVGTDTGTPGVGEAGAHWVARTGVRAVGAETIAFEHIRPRDGHRSLPAHRILLVDHGIHIIETMRFDELAGARRYEFLFVLAPLPIVGATGSPVRPLAIVSSTGDGGA